MAMNGTSSSHHLAIDLIPPRMTAAVKTVMTAPLIQGEMPSDPSRRDATELACTALPMPNAETAVSAAKTRPSQRQFIPRSNTYIGPPAIWPEGVFTRYFTESKASPYLVAIPKTPVSHIHKTAPGPPAA